MGYIANETSLAGFHIVSFLGWFIFNEIGSFALRFVLGSLFQQLRVFNNFSASLFGSVRFVFQPSSFVFNNLSGSFLKKGILFCFYCLTSPEKTLIRAGIRLPF